ncbi:MAG: aminotransferase class V-fold PLP-dependent enzyme [Pseudomonadota bacterium]
MNQLHSFPTFEPAMAAAATHAMGYRASKTNLQATTDADALRRAFGGQTPEIGTNGEAVIAQLIEAAQPGLVGSTQPGFHAWVMGSSNVTGVAADWLTSIWGQNAGIYQCSPAAAIAEEVACDWVLDMLDLPRTASVGVTTGATMAGFIGLAAARDEVLRRAGCDLAQTGLQGAPTVSVFLSEDTHVSNRAALRYLGFGTANIVEVAADAQGRMRLDDITGKMAKTEGPKIIIATAGHINSGAFDPFDDLADLAATHDAWLHVDAAFGLWARTSPKHRYLTRGIERADSWSTDGHKWLQIPFDAGFAIVKNRQAHRRAMDISASYLPEAPGDGRSATHYNPELSRRARGFAVWAVLKSMGRAGVADMVCNHCDCASLLAHKLENVEGIEVLNDVVLNQIVLRFGKGQATDRLTAAMVDALNADGRHHFRTAMWQGHVVMRVSVIGENTGPQHMQILARKIVSIWGAMALRQVAA